MRDNTKVIEGVATLLCQGAVADDPDFFVKLAAEMERRGYTLEAHQKGVQGTLILVTPQGANAK